MSLSTPFKLLKEKRFGPFFWTQFFGAFNDNLFKNGMLILIAYKVGVTEAESGAKTALAGGLFILPFFLFSPLAGQLADKFDKTKIIRRVKIAEILFMTLAALGFWYDNEILLFAVLFLMGVHSTFFGPIKYSILPQTLKTNELMAGNAMIQLGTFLAILIGTIAGGMIGNYNVHALSGAVIGIAVIGYMVSLLVPPVATSDPKLKINYNFLKEFWGLRKIAHAERSVHLSILGISWFWFYGATFLGQIPNFTRFFVGGDPNVGTIFLAVFSTSIAIGSILCSKLSKDDIELGLIPLGAFGLSLFALDLFFIKYAQISNPSLIGFAEYFSDMTFMRLRIIFDLMMIGISGSFYIVPLYALIQKRGNPAHRSRLIAWLNIDNSLFMVCSTVMCMILYKLQFTTIQIFAVVSILNLIVCTYIFSLIPEFLFRFMTWILASTIYRIKIQGRDNIPLTGAGVIVANHVSFIDWFIITAACRRPVRFVMDHSYFYMPVFKWFFILSKAIPIASAKESPAIKEKSFELISKELQDGQLVCIFPEGTITRNGELNIFKPGVERILAKDPVPVTPISLHGLWGSFFSRKKGSAMSGLPHPRRRKIIVKVGVQLPPVSKADMLEKTIRHMLSESE